MLFKTPFVTRVAIASLALGIGANAAIFSLFNQLLLRPLPVTEPDRLVNLLAPGPEAGLAVVQPGRRETATTSSAMRCSATSSGRRRFSRALPRIVCSARTCAYDSQTLNGEGLLVSGSYFPVLGVKPALGRLLCARRRPETGRIARWSCSATPTGQTRFGANPNVLDETMIVNGQHDDDRRRRRREGFDGTTLGAKPQVFVPITMRAADAARASTQFDNRRNYWVVPVRAAEAGRHDRPGARGAQRAVSRDHQRRRSAAAERA